MFLPLHDDNPTSRFPVVTIALIVINLVSLLYVSRLPAVRQELVVLHRGFLPARVDQLKTGRPIEVPLAAVERQVGLDLAVPAAQRRVLILPADRGDIVQSWFTAMFLHGGWMHLIGNMWFLWLFGNNIEDRLGHAPFALFYLVGGLIAWWGHWMTTTPDQMTIPVIGASGAVAAVSGAYLVTFPRARIHCLLFVVIFVTIIEVPALIVLGIWFAMQLFEGMREIKLGISGGVALWAHVAGFVGGAVIMPVLALLIPNRTSSAARRYFE